jgi:parallel beta-helix repeat protein
MSSFLPGSRDGGVPELAPALSAAGHLWYPTLLMRVAVVALIVSVGMLGSGRDARAAECGGPTPCACGDTVTADTHLAGDLGPCEGSGLVVREDAVLDCGGHAIRGRAGAGRTFGVVLDGTDGAVVRDCTVTGFRYGIELSGARRSRVVRCTVVRTGDPRTRVGYGIHLSRSSDNVVQDCVVRDSADEGIHVGSGSDRNTVLGTHAHDNGRENVYVLGARGTRLVHNRGGGAVSANVYLKHAVDSHLEGNRFEGRPVVVRGRATDTLLVDNVLEGGLRVEAYREDGTLTRPTRTVVRGGRLAGDDCLRLVDADDARLENVSLTGCRTVALRSAGRSTTDLLGTSLDGVGLDLAGGATLRLLARLRVDVRTAKGAAVPGAALRVRDRLGVAQEACRTDRTGTAGCTVQTHAVSAGGLVALTPVELTVEADGHGATRLTLTDPLEPTVTVTLGAGR